MSQLARVMIGVAVSSLLLATLAGAYGSHGLTLDPTHRAAYETAVAYQFYHSLGLGLAALWHERCPRSQWIKLGAALLVIGMLLFCGGIYATSFGATSAIGGVVPIGGLAFMGAWLALAVAAVTVSQQSR